MTFKVEFFFAFLPTSKKVCYGKSRIKSVAEIVSNEFERDFPEISKVLLIKMSNENLDIKFCDLKDNFCTFKRL